MTRNLKAPCLVLLAICALGALTAQAASAATEHEFHSDGEKTVLTGNNVGSYKWALGTAGTVECTGAQFKATLTGTAVVPGSTYKADTLTVIPTTTGCTFGGQPAIVNFNHCALVFDSDTTTGNPDGGEHANYETECSGESKIEIDTSICTITIGPQTVNHAVRYVNDTASSIEITTTAKKVVTGKAKTTEGQTGCLLFPTGAIGTFNGLATYNCYKDEGEAQEGTGKTTPSIVDGPTTECKVSNL